MTDIGYMIGIIVMAVMTIVVLTVGTLAAADLLPRREHRHEKPPGGQARAAGPESVHRVVMPPELSGVRRGSGTDETPR